jgi:hypothetical protein
MIIRSFFRKSGGLAAHLERADTNELVHIRDDLGRGAPADLTAALQMFTAISRTNTRAVRELLHIKISPDHAMSNIEVDRIIEGIEREHKIPASMPRFVVEHAKGRRSRHFHLVYPIVDPKSGRAISSSQNYLADETISRLAEIEFGERITPGPRQGRVIEELHRRGLDDEAGQLEAYASVQNGDRLDGGTRQAANRLGVDLEGGASLAYDVWKTSAGDWAKFGKIIASHGYVVARGDKATLLVHEASGAIIPLARALRQRAKAAKEPVSLRERDLQAAFPNAEDFNAARDKGLESEIEKAKAAVDAELGRLSEEAVIDGQIQLAERLRIVRERERRTLRDQAKRTLKGRREAIQAAYARRDRVRRARVNRGFFFAGIFGRRDLQKLAFGLAATSVLLAGGGVGLALIAGGLAIGILPTRERARAQALQATIERTTDHAVKNKELAAAYDEIKMASGIERAQLLDFGQIKKPQRPLAGLFLLLTLKEKEGVLDASDAATKADAVRVLGGDLANRLAATLIQGSGRAGLTILGWYDPVKPGHHSAAAAALEKGHAPISGGHGQAGQATNPNRGKGWER